MIPGISTWIAFNFGSFIVLHNSFLPAFISSSVLLITNLYYKKRIEGRTITHQTFISLISLTVYLGVFLTCNPAILSVDLESSLTIVIGSYFALSLITFLFVQVKRHEINKEKLFLSEKERMIGQLAATVSHEIRNPLTTARGFYKSCCNVNTQIRN